MKIDFDKEFKKIRRYYRVVIAFFQNIHFILKWFLKLHDTLATDENINPDEWNRHINIFRDSYKVAFEVWVKDYMYNGRDVSMKKGHYHRYKNKEECYDYYYNALNQKSMRFLIDLITTMCLEDTIYRELLGMWMFEVQFRMNANFNPDRQNHHVLYCNYLRNDKDYWKFRDKIKKAQTMGEKYKQNLSEGKQYLYGMHRMQLEKDKMESKKKEIDDNLRYAKENMSDWKMKKT